MSITVQRVRDSDTTVGVLVQGYGATAAGNTLVLQANTVMGANASISPVYIDLEIAEITSSVANGYVQLVWVATANTPIVTVGDQGHMHLEGLTPNDAGAGVTGDIGLLNTAMGANDSFSMMLTFRKRVDASGSFANLFSGWNQTGLNQSISG